MANSQPMVVQTERGTVELIVRASPQQAARQLDPGIGVFSQYRSILTRSDSLQAFASDPASNLCLALSPQGTVAAYCVRRPAPPEERWARLRPPIMHEVFGETGRGWRGYKLMKPMLSLVCLEPDNEELILYIVGYSWTWDLDGTKKTLTQYRDTIIHLLAPLGFKQYPTNEPNVSLRAENLFMARLGAKVDQQATKRFTNLLFGIYEED